MLSGQRPPGHRLPLVVIGRAVRLYHRLTLRYWVEELLLERGSCVTRESIWTWCLKFSDLFAPDCATENSGEVKHWLWRAVDERGVVLDVSLQHHRGIKAAHSFFARLLGEYEVPEIIHTDKL